MNKITVVLINLSLFFNIIRIDCLSSFSCHPLIPIYHWPIKDLNLNDLSSNHADMNGIKIGFESDRFGNPFSSLSLNGPESYSYLPHGIYFNSSFSITVWIKPRLRGSKARILDFGNGPHKDNIILAQSYDRLNHAAFVINKGETVNEIIHLESYTPLLENEWTFVVIVYDGLSVTMYFNDSIVAYATSRDLPFDLNLIRTKNYVGKSNFIEDNYSYSAIDDLRLYNRPLSFEEIQRLQLKNEDEFICDNLVIVTCSLTNHWPINSDTFIYKVGQKDTIGNVDMTVKPNSGLSTDNIDRFGNLYSAISLKGIYGYLPSGVYFFLSFTISLWIKPELTTYSYIIDFGNGPSSDNIILTQSYTILGYPTLLIYKGNKEVYNLRSNVRLFNGVWSFLAVTFDGRTASIYIDGKQTGVLTRYSDFSLDPYLLRKKNFIGKSNSDYFNSHNSLIDDLRFFSRSLSKYEIVELMKKKDEYEDEPDCVYMFSHGTRRNELKLYSFFFVIFFYSLFLF